MTESGRQFVRFLFLKVDPAWRRLPPAQQGIQKTELAETLLTSQANLLLRAYSLSGTRGDVDLLLWQVSDGIEPFQHLQTALLSTRLGGFLTIPYSFLGVTRRSVYQLPDQSEEIDRLVIQPQDSRYLFVYPFVKTREWYSLPLEQRQPMMEEHIQIGRKFPEVTLNTIYSFGLDDQEFVVAFESDDPARFVSLVMALRESASSAYTLRDTPTFTCIQMSLWDALDSMGGGVGASGEGEQRAAADDDGFLRVARLEDLPAVGGKRVYHGPDAIALFRIGEQIYAVGDRCTHGRASLSEGSVDQASCILTCPWHGGQYDLQSGAPRRGPVRVALKTFDVRVDDGWISVR